MTWTYTHDPANSIRDRIRFLTGDTDADDGLVSDEEIAWVVSEVTGRSNPSSVNLRSTYQIAWRVMSAIAAIFQRQVNVRLGKLGVSAGERAKAAEARVAELRDLAYRSAGHPKPWAGGLSKTGKESTYDDPDTVQARFRRGQFQEQFHDLDPRESSRYD